jgi:hypothetical protein
MATKKNGKAKAPEPVPWSDGGTDWYFSAEGGWERRVDRETYDATSEDFGLTKDPVHVVLVGDGRADFHAGSFLVCCDARKPGRKFFVQVVEPQSNLNRDATSRFDPVSLNRMFEIQSGRAKLDSLVRDTHLYTARLCAMQDGDELRAVTIRPNIGTVYREAAADEVCLFVQLPQGEGAYPVGKLAYSDVELNFAPRLVFYHVLVAGSTGSGKTHTCANLVDSCSKSGTCVVVLDAKPDYQLIDESSGDLFEGGIPDAMFFTLDKEGAVRGGGREHLVSVPASSLDLEALAAATFWRPSDEDQLDNLAHLLNRFADDQEGKRWSWGDFTKWTQDKGLTDPGLWGGQPLSSQTARAISTRLAKRRPPSWVDQEERRSGKGIQGKIGGEGLVFNLPSLVKAGRVVVTRVPPSQAGSRSYALLLAYLVKEAFSMRGTNNTPLCFLVDEAHDLFTGTRRFVGQTTAALDRAGHGGTRGGLRDE